MPTCLKHQQSYGMGEWCTYCGAPEVPTLTTNGIADGLVNRDELFEKLKAMDNDWQTAWSAPPCQHSLPEICTGGVRCRMCGIMLQVNQSKNDTGSFHPHPENY